VPIHVDVAERLDEIARATIAVARRRGASGITIRDVAAELGGSTARVTNYIPNRTALVGNSVTYMLRRWEEQRAADVAPLDASEQVLGLTRWAVEAEPDDLIFRQLLVELMAQRGRGLPGYLRYAHGLRDELADSSRAAGAPDPDFAGDVLFLLIRGFHYATVEGWAGMSPADTEAFLARAVALVSSPPTPR
jgi:AcrR family transcriptional regulator